MGFWLVMMLVLLAFLAYAVMNRKPGMQREYRDNIQGLADLLRYSTPIADGVLLGKGGELIAGMFYRGMDTESATDNELNAVSARINGALARLGSGWMVHVDVVRDSAIGYPGAGEFYAPVLAFVDAERRGQYNKEEAHFESVFAIILTYVPPSRFESKATAMMVEQSADLTRRAKSVHDQVLMKFEQAVNEFQGQISAAVDQVVRMRTQTLSSEEGRGVVTVDVLLGYLHYCVTGIRQQIALPRAGVYADIVIGSQDFTGGNTPRVGAKHIRVVSIEGFPSESHAGILDALGSLPVVFRWSTRFIFLEAAEGKGFIDSMRKKWKQKVRGMKDQMMNSSSGPVDEDAANMQGDAQLALSEANSGLVKFGHYTSVIVLMDEDHEKVDEAALVTANLLRNINFTARVETWNSVEAYLGSLPGHGHENVRRPVIHSLNLAHLIPTTAAWPGPQVNPCDFYPRNSPPLAYAETTGSAPFRLNLHVGDVGHTLILGPTGAGKSTLLEYLQAQHFRYPRAKVFKFEKGYSSFILCNSTAGVYYDIGGEHSTFGLCPLGRVDRPSERKWAEGYIETLLELQGITVTASHRATVRAALQLLGTGDADRRTMTDFVSAVQDAELQEALQFYTLSGDNDILDEKTDSASFSRMTVFEMENLMNMGPKHTIPVLLHLFRCIERQFDGSPVLLVLDEAWLMLEHPIFQEKIKEWLKVLRKANCAVIFATQSISDVGKCAIRDVIYESCKTKILLANPEATNEASLVQYRAIGLNERQIAMIGAAVPKRDYYYLSPMGKRMFRLGLGPMAMSMVGASGKDDVAMARQLIAEHGKDWVPEWLRHCAKHKAWGAGLNDWARLLGDELRKAA